MRRDGTSRRMGIRARLMAILVALGVALPVGAATYRLEGGPHVNITFQSETALETILGSTRELYGVVETDPEGGRARVELAVPVASLRTGIDLRDEHLRSAAWLDAERYPEIRFESADARREGARRWIVRGRFAMHGVGRDLELDADVREVPEKAASKAGLGDGEWIRISAAFQVRLSDFDIAIPGNVAGKVNEVWDVRIQAYARAANP